MTILRSLFVLLLLIPSVSAAAPSRLETAATITAVTIYQDRALVTRTAVTQLKPGMHLIVIQDLPVLLQDDSVRVEGKGTGAVTINSIEVKRRFLAQTADKRVKELDGEIRVLELAQGRLDSKKAGLAAQKSFLDSIRLSWSDRISKELATRKPTLAELTEIMGFVGSGVTRVDEQGRDVELEKKLLKEKIDALKRQKTAATGSQRKESKQVEILVEVRKEGRLTLELSGVVSQASWEPAYDVRLSSDARTAEMTYRALVYQQTGEDWSDAQLTLSTAQPAAGGAPPELYPWMVAFPRPRPVMAPMSAAPRPEARSMKKAATLMERDDAANEIAEEAPAGFQTAQIESGITSVAFRIAKPVVIPSDGSKQGVVISVDRLPITSQYVAVPKLSPAVYLTAELINKADFPLLPGEIRIFTGPVFTGNAVMKKVAAGEKFTLPFGSDDQIIVKREEQKQHKEAGLFGGNRMRYQYKVTATNLRKETQSVIIRDQVPVPENNEIRVSLDEAGLKPDEKKEDGTIIWTLKLSPGEKREFNFGIVVEYPKDREVVGL